MHPTHFSSSVLRYFITGLVYDKYIRQAIELAESGPGLGNASAMC
jgi:hypothetical protein